MVQIASFLEITSVKINICWVLFLLYTLLLGRIVCCGEPWRRFMPSWEKYDKELVRNESFCETYFKQFQDLCCHVFSYFVYSYYCKYSNVNFCMYNNLSHQQFKQKSAVSRHSVNYLEERLHLECIDSLLTNLYLKICISKIIF